MSINTDKLKLTAKHNDFEERLFDIHDKYGNELVTFIKVVALVVLCREMPIPRSAVFRHLGSVETLLRDVTAPVSLILYINFMLSFRDVWETNEDEFVFVDYKHTIQYLEYMICYRINKTKIYI